MFARSNSRYGTLFVQTDGGTTNQPKIYAWGGNSYGNHGAGVNNSSGASTTAQGNWFGNEIKFMTRGNPYDQATGTAGHPGGASGYTSRLKDQVVGTQYDTTLAASMKIGKIVMIWAQSHTNSSYTTTVLMDEYGHCLLLDTFTTPTTLLVVGIWTTITICSVLKTSVTSLCKCTASLSLQKTSVGCTRTLRLEDVPISLASLVLHTWAVPQATVCLEKKIAKDTGVLSVLPLTDSYVYL